MSASKVTSLDKGGQAEECLREYFRDLSSFVVRGVPVREGSDDVTDIDLWVYTRATAHARHIAIVDIKNKRKGKPFERAVWVKGLQTAVNADEAVIASSGISDKAERFSERMDVRVISRSVFDAIVKRYSPKSDRLSLEELNDAWKEVSFDRSNLKARVESAKANLSRTIDFRSLNGWVDDGATYLKAIVDRERVPGALTRAAYFCCALVAIGADYLGKHRSLASPDERRRFFLQGLVFGSAEEDVSRDYMKFTESMVTEFLDASGFGAARIRSGFEEAVKAMPMNGLAEYFARPHTSSELYRAALALEEACFARQVVAPRELSSVEAKRIVGLISDYAGLKRKEVLGVRDEPPIEDGGASGSVEQSRLL